MPALALALARALVLAPVPASQLAAPKTPCRRTSSKAKKPIGSAWVPPSAARPVRRAVKPRVLAQAMEMAQRSLEAVFS
jgi:hypothetical protein